MCYTRRKCALVCIVASVASRTIFEMVSLHDGRHAVIVKMLVRWRRLQCHRYRQRHVWDGGRVCSPNGTHTRSRIKQQIIVQFKSMVCVCVCWLHEYITCIFLVGKDAEWGQDGDLLGS